MKVEIPYQGAIENFKWEICDKCCAIYGIMREGQSRNYCKCGGFRWYWGSFSAKISQHKDLDAAQILYASLVDSQNDLEKLYELLEARP